MDIRQRSGTHRWLATSRDGGKTWSEPRPGAIMSTVACAIEGYPLAPGDTRRCLLVWTGPKEPGRKNLVVRVSEDQGQTFPRERPIYEGYAAYSDLALLADRAIGALWERGVKRGYEFISFTRLDATLIDPSR